MNGTIAVDFDGVLHAYRKGWHDGTIYDDPVPGSRSAMAALMDRGYTIVIYSTRCYDRKVGDKVEKNQVSEMIEWLTRHQIPFSRVHTEPGKPLCKLFIDDRAYRFDGRWPEFLDWLEYAEPL